MRNLSMAEKCRGLMYKRSILAEINYTTIHCNLYDMQDVCGNIHYILDDDETLINAFDGNEDEAYEFRFSFTDLDYEIENLLQQFREMFGYRDEPERDFNDMTVSLLGDWFTIIGFDAYREDFFPFDYNDLEKYALEESQKRIMRKTKKEILDNIGLVMALILRYFDIKTRYDYLKATIDIFKDENTAFLKLVKSIDNKYKELFDTDGKIDDYDKKTRKTMTEFDNMVEQLPEKFWVE